MTELPAPIPRHALARPEFLKLPGPPAHPLGPAHPLFPHRIAQPSHRSVVPLIPYTSHAYPLPPVIFGSPTSSSLGISDPSIVFSTPPTRRRVFFGTSPQSPAQKSHSAAFGIREPLPSPPLLPAPPDPPSQPSLLHQLNLPQSPPNDTSHPGSLDSLYVTSNKVTA